MRDEAALLAAWGRVVYRHPWPVLVLCAVLWGIFLMLLLRGGELSSGKIEGIEAERGLRHLEQALELPGESSFSVIVEAPGGDVRDPAFGLALEQLLAPLRNDARVDFVHAPDRSAGRGADALTAERGDAVLVHVGLNGAFQAARRNYPAVRAQLQSDDLPTTATGHLAFMEDLDRTLKRDLIRAELVSLPLALLVLIWVFGGLVAATLPVVVGALSVSGGVGLVFALSRHVEMAAYTVNVVSLIGLGVAIDYSLFIVARYRETLSKGVTAETALATSLATSGRAVLYSGLAVGIGLAGLLFFPGSWLQGLGLAGAIVVGLSVFYALTMLPAMLSLLGPRIDALPLFRRRSVGETAFWPRLSAAVMRHPLWVLLPTLVLLLAIGLPFLKLDTAAADVRMLPASTEARRGYETLQEQFPGQSVTHVPVVVVFPQGTPLTPERIGALHELSRRMADLPGVRRVKSLVNIDPALARADYIRLLSAPAGEWPVSLRSAVEGSTGGSVTLLTALVEGAPEGPQARAVVTALRMQRSVADGQLFITGASAHDMDVSTYLREHLPAAGAFVVAAMLTVLYWLLRSPTLPLAALLMNLLSIAGAFGALVWIFQLGHLSDLLGFTPGPIESSLPILLFCVVFGLSMDYEVLLLSRIQEEYLCNGDNTQAVAAGLEYSGRLITGAAAIMIVVFAAFAMADIVLIKAMGLSLAVAIALDAVLVRCLIVPASMRLMGRYNWHLVSEQRES